MSSLSEGIVKRLTLARYLFRLASEHASLNRGVATYACINLLQDALEIFLVSAAEHVHATVSPRTDFPQYLDIINSKLSPNELPLRARLLEINRVRINSKHYAIAPNPTELRAYVENARDFFDGASTQLFDRDFWTISLVALLDEGEKKELLIEAELALGEKRFSDCLIACRKALFLEFEAPYDIQRKRFSRAPKFALDSEWQQKNVRDPFDRVVIDRSTLNADLLKEGVDSRAFWNVRSLTPEVYRGWVKKTWKVKQDPDKLHDEGAQERAAYVFENTLDLILKKEANKRAVRRVASQFRYCLRLRKEGTPIYSKADGRSEVVCLTPLGVTEMEAQYATEGLEDEETYWKVLYAETDEISRSGYILQSDLVDDGS